MFFFRGVPMLVQLLLVYYLLPFAGINVPPLVAAISAVSLCSASYIAEILRGGFLSIPPGHIEAARMLGLSPFDMLRRILVPQAFRLTLPSLVNEMVLLIKASSLISVVGIAEITRTAQNIAASTYRPLEAYVAAGPHLLRDLRRALAGRARRRSTACNTPEDSTPCSNSIPSVITHNLPAIGAGLATTLGTWIAGVVLGTCDRLSSSRCCNSFADAGCAALLRAYIELFRGTPFLVQLFLLYYGGPSFGLTLEPLTAGVLGLGLYGSAYFAEAFRSGFQLGAAAVISKRHRVSACRAGKPCCASRCRRCSC